MHIVYAHVVFELNVKVTDSRNSEKRRLFWPLMMVGWLYWGLTPLLKLRSYQDGRRHTCVSWLSHTSTNTIDDGLLF